MNGAPMNPAPMNPASMPQMPAQDPLAGLRDYHLPDPVSWWPPAPGWWLLALLVLVFVAGLVWWLMRRHRRRAAARQALSELVELRTHLEENGDNQVYVRALSRLLRRFALSHFRRNEVAGLTGNEWLAFLDAHGGNGDFQQGDGRLLSEAPYRPSCEIHVENLAKLVEKWIRNNQEARA